MVEIHFKIAAKTDVGVVRDNNEDNFQASSDLTQQTMTWTNNEECTLGNKGALLVVADGMGGMNAGEVASEIAINTVKELFSPEKLEDESIFKNDDTIDRYLKYVIREADKRIKKEGKDNPETHGMGTTIVMAWLYNGKLYVAWCGDSRAYVFNPQYGLIQISKDHSYVQELVDQKKLTRDEAFDFPQSNIITRCLSASNQPAIPDVIKQPYKVCDGDVVLLCSDGLSGLIRDVEIEYIISENSDNLSDCVSTLIAAACEAGGHDNITVAMCKIISGGEKSVVPPYNPHDQNSVNQQPGNRVRKNYVFYSLLVLFCIIIAGVCVRFSEIKQYLMSVWQHDNNVKQEVVVAKPDSLVVVEDVKDSLEVQNLEKDETSGSLVQTLSEFVEKPVASTEEKPKSDASQTQQQAEVVQDQQTKKTEPSTSAAKENQPEENHKDTVTTKTDVKQESPKTPNVEKKAYTISRGLEKVGDKKYRKLKTNLEISVNDLADLLKISINHLGCKEGEKIVFFSKNDASHIIKANETLYIILNDEE